ncbi:MAG: glycoside hydrolase family 2 [Clostridia bacterium]|nr:glycoside hydrolase family 2 [Clostridia bacterium]
MDVFAQIAANGIGGRDDLLYTPEPEKFDEKICVLDKKQSAMNITPKMCNREELYKALSELKEKYKPFLADLAPKLGSLRDITEIKSFKLNGEDITIPHYEGPLGNQKQVYEAVFNAEAASDKAAYICFDGADYYAVVYVNGVCVGTHEGFFSPFEFEVTDVIKNGENELKIELYNDYIYMGNAFADQEKCEGDKLYAATGPGWDDAKEGWHHCPAGMGLYNSVRFEVRNRLNITDLFIRPMDNGAELWIEVENADYKDKYIGIDISIYGQNFNKTVVEGYRYIPETVKTVGRGDSLTEAMVKEQIGKGIPMPLKHGKNIYKIFVEIPDAKKWELDTPYLYQAQVSVVLNDKVEDCVKQQFGMRSFVQDADDTPKGMFYLNGRKIRLRGANTMGFEQQDVMRGDIDRLIDDILLAKLCNMNFLRLTQRPVQDEVYEYCDKLGLMTQSDLPLFGCMRRTKLCEGVRQAEEMERLVRKHPCNVIVSYINEPFPNANNEPHRHLNREELESFFTMCDIAVHMQNPDRVIKHVDGDYDPPTEGMPDNHCYPMWYNGHGIDIGRLNKGYWLSVKPDWYYGCGEYGAEGLDFAEVMREEYPKEWIKEPFDPKNIIRAQTGSFHYFFYDTPDTIDEWVEKSQRFQAFAAQIMTEAFRRDNRMISNAIHLFIDAWPSGWMKTIMDCRRNPKPAYFAYRNALEPIMISLRTDRFAYFSGEKIKIEAYICNDTNMSGDYKLNFEYYTDGEYTAGNETDVHIDDCKAGYAATAEFTADASDRKTIKLRAVLTDKSGEVITYNEITVEVFADTKIEKNDDNVLIEKLPVGEHEIAGEKVVVKPCGMLPLHFVSRKTGHSAVAEFKEKDFSYWYDRESDMITPLLETTFTAKGFTPILTSGNTDERGEWSKALACAEKVYEGKRYIICQVDLRQENPVAKRFISNLYKNG